MHVSDGVLSVPVTLAGWAGSACGLALSLRGVKEEKIPQAAVVTACFFVGSTIHVPLGGTSIHLVLSGLCGVVAGPLSFLAVFIGLLFQFLLFSHGGLTSLGFNACSMGGSALAASAVFSLGARRYRKTGKPALLWITSFGVGAGAVLLAAGIVAAGLAASGKTYNIEAPAWLGHAFLALAPLWFLAHVPLALVEGFVTAAAVMFLARVEPRLVGLGPREKPRRR